MSWQSLEAKAKELGFEVRLGCPEGKSRVSAEDGWIRVARYEAGSGLWVRPVSEAAKRMTPLQVMQVLAASDRFVMLEQDYDGEYATMNAPYLAAASNPDAGRMIT